ncbi:MAG: hypothetical protein HYV16_15965 [Gammaproteobacteria bacterium]|nr:hypothetical protein [Gammaproteobacteria bacterium]
MLTFKKSGLSLAVVGVLAAPMASAMTGAYDTAVLADYTMATNVFGATSSTVTTPDALNVNISGDDVFLGRTTGFNINVTLSGGLFSAISAPTTVDGSGLAYDCDNADADGNTATGVDADERWTLALAAGGAGSATATYAVTPPAAADCIGITQGTGELVQWAAGGMTLNNVDTILGASGGAVTATVKFNDPVGGATLEQATIDLFASTRGVVFTGNSGSTATRIDVGSSVTHQSKTRFALDGDIGDLDSPTFTAGTFDIDATSNCDGTDATDHCTAGNVFTFGALAEVADGNWTNDRDTVSVTVTGTDFTPFMVANSGSVTIRTGADCSAGTLVKTLTVGASSATGSFTMDEPDGSTFVTCFNVPTPNTVVIDDQELDLSVTVDLETTASAGTLVDPDNDPFTSDLFSMNYNGSVVDVFTFNPAGNSSQESFVRISATGSVGGNVSIVGTDDAGNTAGPVTLALGQGESVQLNSGDIENGNVSKGLTGSFGDGTGKWRMTITGEFDGMIVTSLNRNNADGTLTNLTDADSHTEQVNDVK